MPKILDVIISSGYGSYSGYRQTFVVIDRPLHFIYERKGHALVANDGGFYSSYYHGRPSASWQAFAGRKFDVPMMDGTVIKASGEWWYGGHEKNAPEEIVSVGVATLDQLLDCYVFSAGYISKVKLDTWLRENTPGTIYRWYDKRRVERELEEVRDDQE